LESQSIKDIVVNGHGAFGHLNHCGCPSLAMIEIPNIIRTIGDSIFYERQAAKVGD
jgi:hypothetical protein